jgi:hypothetical protein
MRVLAVLVALMLAGCAPQQPLATSPVLTTDFSNLGETASRREGAELVRELLANPKLSVATIMRRRAEANVAPAGPSPEARRERERAVQAESLRLTRVATDEMRRRREDDKRRDEAKRRQDYCRDLAHNMFVRTSRTSDLLAASIMGQSSEMNRYYQDCMDSFARVDRLMGR